MYPIFQNSQKNYSIVVFYESNTTYYCNRIIHCRQKNMSSRIRVCSISAYATLGSRINLSALSILLKELYKIDNTFDNTRVRKKHDSVEALTCSRTFFNSLTFPLKFRCNDQLHNLHIHIFTSGTVHIAGASDYEVTTKNAFQCTFGLVASCHAYDPDVKLIEDTSAFCLRDIRIAMIHSIYNHPTTIDRERTASRIEQTGRNVRYDPVLHNAINVRFTSDDGALLIFKSGKILITGCKQMNTCEYELEQLIPLLMV